MRKHIINVVGFVLLAIATIIGILANVMTLINFDSEVNTVWEKWQAIVFIAVLTLLFFLAIYFIVIWSIRLIQDIKIKKE